MQFVSISTKKVHNLHQRGKLMQIRCQKGTRTKMHKCLVRCTIVIHGQLLRTSLLVLKVIPTHQKKSQKDLNSRLRGMIF